MVTPNGRTMTTTSISADRNMAILLILVFNGKIYPEKGTVRKVALCPISKRHICPKLLEKEGKDVMRLRNVGEETQRKHKMKEVENIESNPDVRGSASEECGGGFGQPCKALDHRSHL